MRAPAALLRYDGDDPDPARRLPDPAHVRRVRRPLPDPRRRRAAVAHRGLPDGVDDDLPRDPEGRRLPARPDEGLPQGEWEAGEGGEVEGEGGKGRAEERRVVGVMARL